MKEESSRRQVLKIPLVLTPEMIDNFTAYMKRERQDYPREAAAQLMQVAIGLYSMPVLEWEADAQKMIDDSYARGHAYGRDASAVHIHVPPGSSLAKEGDVLVVRPGDISAWKPVDTGSIKG